MAGYLDGAPDIGNIGGGLYGDDGENSVTGGGFSQEQNDANIGVNNDSWGYDFGEAGFGSPGAFSLSDLFGYSSGSGLPTSGSDFSATAPSFDGFMESPFGKGARALLGMNPIGQLANLAYGASKGNYGSLASAAIPGMGGTIAGMGINAMMGRGPSASNFGQMGGSMLGGAMGGPLGSMLGGQLGGQMMSGAKGYSGPNQASSAPGTQGGQLDLGAIASGLVGAYQAQQAAKDAQRSASATSSGVDASLENMFGQNSAYSQQLRQELNRRDAASGRRSQYGPREVELQAKLAQMRAQSEPSMRNAATNASQQQLQASMARRVAGQQALSQLFGIGKSTGLFDKVGSYFASPTNQVSAPQTLSEYGLTAPMTLGDGMVDSGDSGGSNWWDDL
jgi:hypothetical protein